MKMLVSWIGTADLRAPDLDDETDVGPVAQALATRSFARVLLLADQDADEITKFEAWLRTAHHRGSKFRE
jgi:hypothetical protein